jgi:hypothetical protein
MCHSSLCFLDFVVTLYANAGEEAQVIPIEDVNKTCRYKEAASGRAFELVHILGVPDPIRKYIGNKLLESPYSPSHHRSLTDEEKRKNKEAVKEVLELYKKPQEFSPVPAALQTMWQARQNKSSISAIRWPNLNERLKHNLTKIEDQRPMPTKPSQYTAVGEAMADEQKSKNHKQFLRLCAQYIEHRFNDWKEARGYYAEEEYPFWIDLWDPELLLKCEEENQDDHPRAVLKRQWELHVKNMKKAKWEEEQALEEARKKDIICLDDTSDEESVKEKPREVICLLDDSDDEHEKENVCNRKRFKKG